MSPLSTGKNEIVVAIEEPPKELASSRFPAGSSLHQVKSILLYSIYFLEGEEKWKRG
jgi:hypothetical protein